MVISDVSRCPCAGAGEYSAPWFAVGAEDVAWPDVERGEEIGAGVDSEDGTWIRDTASSSLEEISTGGWKEFGCLDGVC